MCRIAPYLLGAALVEVVGGLAFVAGFVIGLPPSTGEPDWSSLTDEERTALITVSRDFESFKRVFLAQTVQWQLRSVQFASARYSEAHGGHYPDFSDSGWAELVDGKYLEELPRNPLSPTNDVGTKLIVIDDPELTARDVDPMTVGWVWHTASSCLMAAGFGLDAGALQVLPATKQLLPGPTRLAHSSVLGEQGTPRETRPRL